ncbi:MAG TPA: hypothetical protein DCZ94_22420 [Lentisphaeria bacterium]|nr:MAG: hypothetical protein A2X48_13660 [Lentisphaerae bacterium GWF2_49_21]HBC89704.1 hypothetical protein [Lentisphaeria bacterium]
MKMSADLNRRDFLKSVAAGVAGLATINLTGRETVWAATDTGAEAAIPQRALGQTGIQAPILGLGGDGIVSDSTDQERVLKFLTEALDAGITYFDTAYVYGKDGQCEKNLGLLMGTARRNDCFLATKTGARTYNTAMKQIETSLTRLRTDHLELVQLHHINDKDDVTALGRKDGALTALRKLRDEKVVRFIGFSAHPDATNVKPVLEAFEWDTLMAFVNPAPFSRPALEQQIPLARKKKMGVIAMKVFGGRPGKLVGAEAGQTAAATLLDYSWSQDIDLALIGVRSRQELLDNLKTARNFKPMSEEDQKALVALFAKSDWKFQSKA